MSKHWDGGDIAFRPETWAALGEHLLPGAFCMAFSGARTYHRMACAIEDAGFILHSMIGWVYGSGFPKATRIDTQVDRAAGKMDERVCLGTYKTSKSGPMHQPNGGGLFSDDNYQWKPYAKIEIPATEMARTWSGHRYGLQALKPALEPICVFQKPYAGRPVDSIVKYGAGSLWIEGGRIAHNDPLGKPSDGMAGKSAGIMGNTVMRHRDNTGPEPAGRWPSNLLLDPCAARALGEMSGERNVGGARATRRTAGDFFAQGGRSLVGYGDTGDASRFFQQCDYALEQAEPFSYNAKAGRTEREAGLLGHAPCLVCGGYDTLFHVGKTGKQEPCHRNGHPTQKPLSLAKYLSTLLLPPVEYAPRRILCPFFGTGSEGIGAHLAGFDEVLGIEMEPQYVEWARARVAHWRGASLPLFAMAEEAAE